MQTMAIVVSSKRHCNEFGAIQPSPTSHFYYKNVKSALRIVLINACTSSRSCAECLDKNFYTASYRFPLRLHVRYFQL